MHYPETFLGIFGWVAAWLFDWYVFDMLASSESVNLQVILQLMVSGRNFWNRTYLFLFYQAEFSFSLCVTPSYVTPPLASVKENNDKGNKSLSLALALTRCICKSPVTGSRHLSQPCLCGYDTMLGKRGPATDPMHLFFFLSLFTVSRAEVFGELCSSR